MTIREVRARMCLTFTIPLLLVACGGSPATSDSGRSEVPESAGHTKTPVPVVAPAADFAGPDPEDNLWSGDIEVRESAIEHIARRDPQSFTAHLQLLLTDADPEIRLSTVENIIDTRPPHARYWLEQAAMDPDPQVNETARQGIAELQATPP